MQKAKNNPYPVRGTGLGLRREMSTVLSEQAEDLFDSGRLSFFEVAPENWMGAGGRLKKQFRAFTERYPFVTHGLSLSIGSPAPLDEAFVKNINNKVNENNNSRNDCERNLMILGSVTVTFFRR